jgi:hypothetical protein
MKPRFVAPAQPLEKLLREQMESTGSSSALDKTPVSKTRARSGSEEASSALGTSSSAPVLTSTTTTTLTTTMSVDGVAVNITDEEKELLQRQTPEAIRQLHDEQQQQVRFSFTVGSCTNNNRQQPRFEVEIRRS